MGHISSSLPCLIELINALHNKPNIILLQETKLPKSKSTAYIDNKFLNYKFLYNNTNTTDLGRNHQITTRDSLHNGVLTIIHKKLHTPENITKIFTSNRISPYLQALKIANKPLAPLFIMDLYVSSHPHDLNLIPKIITQINILMKHHPTHIVIFAGDFNIDILLQWHTHEGTPQAPIRKDHEWAQCM